ncbi:hypothetical protein [Burkholderia dolosa]|uniref:hypothetical protein n=1 Tax=Burkholderia dolosa TaxID=152500 RepID=UPI0027D32586|nr:hypothetical protein [Burkholderia dolosa]
MNDVPASSSVRHRSRLGRAASRRQQHRGSGQSNAPAQYAIGCGALALLAIHCMDEKSGKAPA